MAVSAGDDKARGETFHLLKWARLLLPLRLSLLWDLVAGGGIEVCTPSRGKAVYLRTVIQADGDVLNCIYPTYLKAHPNAHNALAVEHRQALCKLNGTLLNLFQGPRKALLLSAVLATVASGGFELINGFLNNNWVWPVISWLGVTFAIPAALAAAHWLIKRFVYCKVRQLLRT